MSPSELTPAYLVCSNPRPGLRFTLVVSYLCIFSAVAWLQSGVAVVRTWATMSTVNHNYADSFGYHILGITLIYVTHPCRISTLAPPPRDLHSTRARALSCIHAQFWPISSPILARLTAVPNETMSHTSCDNTRPQLIACSPSSDHRPPPLDGS